MNRLSSKASYLALMTLAFIPVQSTLAQETEGECSTVFGGYVCTWEYADGAATAEVGATIPLSAIEGAPDQVPMVWPPATAASLDFPPQATANTGFTHMTVNWEAVGHAPRSFLTPHFDFHFYLIPEGQRSGIDCSNEQKPASVPEGYVIRDEGLPPELAQLAGTDTLVGTCVAEMGMHAITSVQAEAEEPFEATMVIGYYQGSPIFFEPMISREYLLRRQSFNLPIPQVPGLRGQPRVFSANYSAGDDAYLFSFAGF